MRCLLKLAIIICCTILIPSCASFQITRTVSENNIFFSSAQPELRIKVNKSFTYRGNKENAFTERCYDDRSAHLERETFIFENRMDDRFLCIDISRLTDPKTFFLKDFIGMSPPLDSGTVDFKDGTYRYIVIAEVYNSIPILLKIIKRISGPTNNISTMIMYGENVDGTWGSPESLTERQKNRLQEFNHNWEKAFEIF